MTEFMTYNVFTDMAFGGNPLAVVPDATTVPEDRLQIIAREFNYSETVFLLPPVDPDNTARLRIFTPSTELPFAGHPTVGAAIALAEMGHGPDLRLELGVGLIEARAEPGSASFTAPQPLEINSNPYPALVARAIRLPAEDLAADPVLAGMGVNFVFAPLRSRDALSRACPDIDAMREGRAAHPESVDFAVAAYWLDGEIVHMRVFAPLGDMPEDPATGSAAAALARLLEQSDIGARAFTVLQGADMGRPSQIRVSIASEGVTIGGEAVRIMEGRLCTL